MTTMTNRRWLLGTTLAVALASSFASGCGKRDDASSSAASSASSSTTPQATTPAPAGDSTPKAADAETRQAVGANEKTGNAGSQQSNVGTAASGAPPYTLNSAPEGNPAPSQGTKADEPAKK